MAFVLGLAITGLLIRSFSASSIQAERDEDTMQALKEAKQALLAWSVAHPNWPGVMPFPDRNGDGDYDGESDCVTAGLSTTHLIGKLPLKGESPCISPQEGLGVEPFDSSGEKLWYAVSMNLIRTNGSAATPVINPGIIDNPTNPWMVVRDSTGAVVSNRAAIVILAPGLPVSGQDRSSPTPSVAQFLDQITIGGVTYSNSDYNSHDEDFIMSNELNTTFNDRIVFITIDELMTALEKRVGEVARAALKDYQDANGYYPYAAQLGTTENYSGEQNLSGTDGLTSGFLPVNHQSCTASFSSSFLNLAVLTCTKTMFDGSSAGASRNSGITEIRITKSGGSNFIAGTNGSCTVSPLNTSRCSCTGSGSCAGLDTSVNCGGLSCIAFSFTGTVSYRITGGKFTHRSGGCAHTSFPSKNAAGCYDVPAGNSVLTCSSSNGTFASSNDAVLDSIPAWFTTNNWQDYTYYHATRPASSSIMAEGKSAEAVIISTSRAINSAPFPSKGAAQVRPSCNAMNEYLDSSENADGDLVYEATNRPYSRAYNDQIFLVSP